MQSRTNRQQTRICLCGRMTVEIGGRTITPPGRQGRLLLAYQIANRSRALRRDELFEVLWEDKAPANPEAGLKTVLSRLRRELGAEVLPPGELGLQLSSGAWIDVEAVEEQAQRTLQALKEGRPREAVDLAAGALALLEGDFLPGLEAKWIDDRRRELDDLALSLRRASVEAGLELGGNALADAERVARELVEQAPYRESGHLLLMRVLAERGDVAEATLVYNRLRRLLRDELGTTPDPGLTQFNEKLLRQSGPAPVEPADAPEMAASRVPLPPLLEALQSEHFVGRAETLKRLWARWEKVSYRSRVIVLVGAPGIGKTRLAACFGDQVHRSGATVLYGRCDEDPLTPYQPFVEALDHYARFRDLQRELPQEAEELRRLPGLRRHLRGRQGDDQTTAAEDRYALFEAFGAMFRRAAEERPLLVVVDDMHWADAPTFKLALYVVRCLGPSRCAFLLTSRGAAGSRAGTHQDEQRESLESRLALLRHDADVERVSLKGLDERATADLISARRGRAPSDAFARDLRGRTGGNPFFIEEALRSLAERSDLGNEEEVDLAGLGVPAGIKEVITQRLDRLSAPAGRVLARASVIGPEFTLPLLATISDLSQDAALDEIEELIRAGILVEVPDKADHFAFSHGLLRETQYGRLIVSRRARIHRRIAEELEVRAHRGAGGEATVSPAELAHHFYEARPAVEPERAARYCIEAARHARQSGAYEDAIAQYGRAVELLESSGSDELAVSDLLLARGKVLLRVGRLDEAQDTFRRVADAARGTGAVDRLALAALGFHGMYTAAGEVDRRRIELLEEAQAALGPSDSPLRARILARLADSLLWLDRERSLELSAEALAMARRLGDTDAIRESLGGRHAALLHAKHLDERLSVSRERLHLAADAGNREAEAEAVRWYMHDLCEQGEVRAAKEQFGRLAELARELRQPQYSSYVRHWACVFAQLHGRLAEAERLADEAFGLAKQAGARDAEMSRLDKRFSIYREQGRLPELRTAVERHASEADTLVAWRALAALLHAQVGEPARARVEVEPLVSEEARAIPRDVAWLYAMAALAETCALVDDMSEPAAVVYRLLLPYAGHCVQIGMDTFWGSAERFLGLAATACGNLDAADHHFAAAARRNREMGSDPLVAHSYLDRASMLLGRAERGDHEEAARLAGDAIGAAEPLGMVELYRRAARVRAAASRSAAPV